MNFADANHAWVYIGGVMTGFLISAGAVAWVVHYIADLVKEARAVIAEMTKVVSQAKVLAYHVSENYVPLKLKVDEIEREVRAIREMMVSSNSDIGGTLPPL